MSRKKEQKSEKDIIDELIAARKARKLTQKELAQIIGCPQPSISRVESRAVSPTLEFVERMCDVLGFGIHIRRF